MAYRFNGTTDGVRFAIGPFGGVTIAAQTIAVLLKRSSTSGDQEIFNITNAAISVEQLNVEFPSSTAPPRLLSNASGNTTVANTVTLNSTSLWYLLVITWAGSGAARFHLYNGTSWTHTNASSGSVANTVVGATDRIYFSGPPTWGVGLAADVVCVGIKRADSADATVETLNQTAWSAWTGFAFDWLIGFDSSLVSGGLLQDQGAAGTGDEVSRSGTSAVSDPPGWSWSAVPPSTFVPKITIIG